MNAYSSLKSAVEQLKELERAAILCVRRPWAPESDCVIVMPDKDFCVPVEVQNAGYAYFLEVHVALEVLSVLATSNSSIGKAVELLIYYAEYDAYPKWVYT